MVSKNIIGSVDLLDLTDEELSGLIRMIECACLPERRMFNQLKNDLKILDQKIADSMKKEEQPVKEAA